MNRHACPDELELGAIADLPSDDPRAVYALECPRCRALLSSYGVFLASIHSESLVGDATDEARLSAFRESLLDAATPRTTQWKRWFAPAFRPAWGLAAAGVVAAIVLVWPPFEAMSPPDAVRNSSESTLEDFVGPQVAWTSDGVRFEWIAFGGAESYAIEFVSTEFEVLGLIDAGVQTEIVVATEDLPRAARVLVRVVALRSGDVLRTSALTVIEPR